MSLSHLSFSSLSSYSGCGERYRLEKQVHVPQLPNWGSIGGSLGHKVTENLDLQDFGVPVDGPLSFTEGFEAFIAEQEEKTGYSRKEWKANGRASKEYPEKQGERFWRDNGDKFVQNWRRMLQSSPRHVWVTPDGMPAVEIEVSGEIGGVPVLGYVDRILEIEATGDLLAVDLKFGSYEPKTPKQLVLYSHLLNRAYPGHTIRYGAFFMARDGILTQPVDVAALDDGRLEKNLQDAYAGITAGRFLPNPSMLCSSCSVRDYCYEVSGPLSHLYPPYERTKK